MYKTEGSCSRRGTGAGGLGAQNRPPAGAATGPPMGSALGRP